MKKIIIDYYVVEAYSQKELIEIVNNMIRDGWQPFGGVSTVLRTKQEEAKILETYIVISSQALVKYDHDE